MLAAGFPLTAADFRWRKNYSDRCTNRPSSDHSSHDLSNGTIGCSSDGSACRLTANDNGGLVYGLTRIACWGGRCCTIAALAVGGRRTKGRQCNKCSYNVLSRFMHSLALAAGLARISALSPWG